MDHRRKPYRYKDYDYSSQGAYFITICSKDRKQLFSGITIKEVGKISDNLSSVKIPLEVINRTDGVRPYEDVCIKYYTLFKGECHKTVW